MSKSRQWVTLTAMVCLAVLAAGWFLVIKPQRAHASELRTQRVGVESHNSQLRSQVDQLRQEQKDLPAVQKLLSQIATKIPDNPALPALIRQLSAAADGAGVDLVSLSPGQPAVAGAGGAVATTTSTTGSTAAAAAPLATIPLAVQVRGTYFNVEQFFSAVEGLSRAMLVTGFTLQPAGDNTSAGGASKADAVAPGTLNAQITAEVFESPSLAPSATTTTGH
jgi:Tfp pilus assembly protein PilO